MAADLRKTLSAVALVVVSLWVPAKAETFASAVTNVTGSFSSSNGAGGPDPDGALVTLGAPDRRFIQIYDNASVTLDFGSLISVRAVMRVYNIDLPYPAAAKIEVSADNVFFTVLAPPAGTLWYDNHPSGYFDIPLSPGAGGEMRYVRFTDLPPDVDGDTSIAGFDLDAVSVSAVPEPSTTALMAAGLLVAGVVGARRRRRTGAR